MRFRTAIWFACSVVIGASQCAGAAVPGAASSGGAYADAALVIAVRGSQRSPENTARDKYRHPRESLAFWGLKPGMNVLEIWPSGSYWTEILAPYAKATNGRYVGALPSATRTLPAKFADKSVYGNIA